ncbi:COG1361 family protein [Alienimonas californiensis]|uniref:Large cysteine-rich periplasmic protein omcB n=1 Tax=Alienimonas californiensis TaxID=2527989 RepID=A0A517P7B4_9PLAN|nr:DUF11 domain-containing protein [Alienimonas californiensis]QDT15271.1 Large cysteine-rich periplasmic protein omcB precursor [Alienimonas californiensis]
MNLTSLRTAAVAAGAALLTGGALSLTQDAAVAVPQAADSGLTLAGPTGEDTIEITRRGPSQIRAGEEFTYDLVLRNISDEPIRGIRVTETTQGVELRGANDKAAQVEGNRLSFNAGQLAAGDSRTLKVTARASETGEARSCIVVDYDPALCTVYKVTKPDLKLVWTLYADRDVEAQCDVAGVYSCDDVFIEYKVTNDGTGETEPIVLTHNLPEGLTYTGKQTVKATVDPLGAGETKAFRVPLELTDDAAGRQLDLSAEAKAGGITASTDAQTVSILEPSLDVRVDGPAEQYLGRDATARVTVTNNSDAPALNTMVAITAPEGARDVRFDTRDFDGETLNVGCLMPGESRTYNATYRVEEAGEFDMAAAASAYCVEAVEKTLTTTYKGISAILIETVDKVDPVAVGENTTYEVYVKNQGSAPDLNVNLTGTLPDGLTFVSATGDSDVKADGKNLTFGQIDELAPGEVVSWNVTVKADKAAKVQFKLNLKSDANPEPIREEEPTTLY